MSDEPARRNLGRGLSALLGAEPEDYVATERSRGSRLVPIEFIHPSALQPRRTFDDEPLQALADSIREKGILQPILVRRHPRTPNAYEIVAGERRWRAAQIARLHEVPVIVRELSDQESLELAIVENVQRQDLSPLEEGEGYRRLTDEFHYSQDDLARRVGKSRSHIANTIRLLALPEEVKRLLDKGELSAGHARALLNAPDATALARDVVARGLNVRQTEKLAQGGKKRGRPPKGPERKDADTVRLENDLSALLGLKVTVAFTGRAGSITIHYQSLDQLDDILNRLRQPATPHAA
jgi:ParB family chromosome partitioning protein